MLELGKAGSAGTEKGVVPVLRDGAVVATPAGAQTASAWTGTRRYPAGRWAWRSTRTADDGLPPAHQVVLPWLEMVLRQRAAAATSAGAGA